MLWIIFSDDASKATYKVLREGTAAVATLKLRVITVNNDSDVLFVIFIFLYV